ncbi:ABC transporter substrate-binding protein [Nostocoides japonicum]|nr:ABC transporter substrate-binding protein [Tetrasphaera japonica]
MITKKATGLVALAVGVALPLAACGGGSGSSSSSSSGTSAAAAKGGTLYYLTKRAAEHLDPQRIYIGRDLADMGRLVYRSLVQFPASTDEKKASTPIPDLATNTGTSSDGGKVWKFTLKDGVKWQDGKPVTCADLKYGLSRTFAQDVITGGPNYILNYMPTVAKEYAGPYKKTGQAVFDKAVTCSSDNKTITYNFEKPWIDFPLAIASLRCFDPYRQDQDQGDKSNYAIFSDGPYKIQGTWTKGQGGTFVRNDQYDASTDGNRKALPDKIVFVEGLTNEVITQRIIADGGNDKFAVTDRVVPPAYYNQVTGNVAKRSVNVNSPFTDYLLPNFNVMTNLKVRQALATATDKTAYAAALGGDKAAIPAKSIITPSVPGYKPNPAFTAPDSGDPAAAKKLLQEAGVTLPYPITITYPGGTPSVDNSFAALKAGFDKAGFKTTLNSLPDTYYDVVQDINYKGGNVVWGGWGADWPSIGTVLPPLFDSRINFGPKTNGQDYGNFKSDTANQMIDAAAAKPTLDEQNAAYAALDQYLGEQVAYIPLTVTRFFLVYGSGVANYTVDPASNMYPDLGVIGVQQ